MEPGLPRDRAQEPRWPTEASREPQRQQAIHPTVSTEASGFWREDEEEAH